MYRNIYIGLAVAIAAGIGAGAAFFFYKTSPPAEPAAEIQPTAEFGGVSLRIEYATTSAGREKGLGGRENIPSDYGMLFVFPQDGRYGFWMKDTLVPLDIFWLNTQGQVISMVLEVATSTYPHVFYPTASARYVLETIAGFARTNNIATGTLLQLKNLELVSE